MITHVLRNPASGRNLGRRRSGNAVRTNDTSVIDLTGHSAHDSRQRLAQAIASGAAEHVAIVGGDGLVHLAIQELALSGVEVTIIPKGTGNDFAAALGIEPGIDVDTLPTTSTAAPVDLIRVTMPATGEMRWVASIVTAGFPADINARANAITLPLGRHVYAVAAVLELPRFSRRSMEVDIDRERVALDSAMLAIGNTRFFGGAMLACPDARHDDGLLHVTSIEGVGRLGIIGHLRARSGGSADRPEVLRRTGRRVEISTPGIELWGDGERIGPTPALLEIVPGALGVHGVNDSQS